MKPVDKPHLEVGALSHEGEKRDHNEDRYSVTAYRLSRGGTPALLAVVADGIGGHQAGEVAAEMAVDAVVERVADSSGRDPLPTLRAAVTDAAKDVISASHQEAALEGMGSTLAIAWIIGRRLYLTYVGDSRIYLHSNGEIHQVSNDHTWVQEALEHDIITEEEVEGHPHAHVLRRHIGGDEIPEVDFRIRLPSDSDSAGSSSNQGLELKVGDTVLLCSDGLTDLVTAEEIGQVLSTMEPADAVHRLVDMARDRGGHDNITVVTLKVPPIPLPTDRSGCLRQAVLAGLIGLLILAAGLFISWRSNFWPFNSTLFSGLAQPTEAQAATASSSTETSQSPSSLEAATATPTPTPTSGPTSTPVPLATVPADDGG